MSLFEQFPYTNYHDLNLDWIIQKVKEAYSPDNPPDMAVISVNGETGAVVLYTDAIVRLPDVNDDTWNIHRIADGSSEGIQFQKNQPAVRINGTNRYPIYDQGNPPPYPVTSVDGQTGTVNTWANRGGQNMTLPVEADGEVWALRRDTPAGYLGIQFELAEDDSPCGFFILKPEDESLQKIKILTESDIPSEAGVVSINGEAGVVVLYAGDIKMASDDNTTVKQAIEGTQGLIVSDYNSASSYSAGDFCLYLGTMYVCTGSTTGSWNPAKWTATSVAAELKSVKSKQATDESNISTLQGQMTIANTRIGQNEAIVAYPENDSTASTNYSVGQYIARNGSLYKVIANISAGDQFTGSNISAVDNLGHEVSALNGDVSTLNSNLQKIGKLLFGNSSIISTTETSPISIPHLSEYNVFMASFTSSFFAGPCYGLRYSATDVRFFGITLASGGAIAYTFACMKTNGDSFNGWETTGNYSTKWGANVTGINDIIGIA